MKNDNIPSVFVTNNFHILNIYAKIIESKTNKVFVHCFVNLIEEIDKKSTILVNDEIKKKCLHFPSKVYNRKTWHHFGIFAHPL